MNKIIALSALVGLLGACFPVGNGDYVVYRIAYAGIDGGDLDPNCYGGVVPADLFEDESDIRSATTFAVFKSGDNYYLDTDTRVLEGTRDDKTFTFKGESTDRQYQGGDGFVEVTEELKITMTVSGAAVTGAVESVKTQVCSGDFCDAEDNYTCEGESTFIGSEIKDVDLGYTWEDAN